MWNDQVDQSDHGGQNGQGCLVWSGLVWLVSRVWWAHCLGFIFLPIYILEMWDVTPADSRTESGKKCNILLGQNLRQCLHLYLSTAANDQGNEKQRRRVLSMTDSYRSFFPTYPVGEQKWIFIIERTKMYLLAYWPGHEGLDFDQTKELSFDLSNPQKNR